MAATTRYFVARYNGTPGTLARVHDTTAAERFVAGGTGWEPYPDLIYLAIGTDEMGWDEITADEADKIQRKLASKAS